MTERLEVLVSADDGRLHLVEVLPAPTSPSWFSLGSPPGERMVQPVVSGAGDGSAELFAFSTNHLGMWRRRRAGTTCAWDDWTRQPDPPAVDWDEGTIALARGRDGRLRMFCVNSSDRKPPLSKPGNRVWHRQETSAGGTWSRWRQHGQPPDAEEVWLLLEANADGRLELLAGVHTPLPSEGFEAWRLREEPPGGLWSTWQRATDPTDPAQRYAPRSVCREAGGRLVLVGDLFGSPGVGCSTQSTPGGDWQPWVPLGAPGGHVVTAVAAAADTAGRVHVVVTTVGILGDPTTTLVWHRHQGSTPASWSDWSVVGPPPAGVGTSGDEVAVAATSSGVHVLATAGDGALWARRLPVAGGVWSPWTSLGRPAGTTELFRPTALTSG